jgi:hypothetical protein
MGVAIAQVLVSISSAAREKTVFWIDVVKENRPVCSGNDVSPLHSFFCQREISAAGPITIWNLRFSLDSGDAGRVIEGENGAGAARMKRSTKAVTLGKRMSCV